MFTVNLTLFVLLGFICRGFSETPTSGPYRSYVNTVKKCNKTTYPLHPNPTILVEMELYNGTDGPSLRGTFEVLSYTAGVKIKTKSLIWEKGKWKTNFVLVDNGCRGSLMPFWMTLFNINFDKQKCAFLKCRVPFDAGNTNKMHHIITDTAEYGKVMFVNEMFSVGKQYKTLYCYEYEGIIEPIK